MAQKKNASLLKKLLYAALALGALGLLAVVIAPFFIPWDKLKDQATSALSAKLGRKVTVESVSVGIFDGVSLNKVSVANGRGFSKEPLFYNERATLRPSLLSLLAGKIVISEINFRSPKLVVEKSADGKFNFSDLSKGGAAEPAPAAKAGKSSMPKVVVASLRVSGGDLIYRDLGARKESAVKGLDILLSGFSLQAGGKSRLEIRFTLENEGRKTPIELTSNFGLDLGGEKLDLASLALNAPGLKLEGSGKVSDWSRDTALDLKLALRVALEQAVKDLAPPSALSGLPKDSKFGGAVSLDLLAKGRLSQGKDLKFDASLAFDKVSVKAGDSPALEDMSGTLKAGPSSAELPALHFKLAGSPVTLKLKASDYSIAGLSQGGDKLRMKLRYELSSPKLNLDPLLAAGAGTEPAKEGAVAPASPSGGMKDFRKVPKGLDLVGQIKAEALHYGKIDTGAFNHLLTLKNGKASSVMDLKLYEGTLWNRVDADLTQLGPAFSYDVRVAKVQYDKLVSAAAASAPDNQTLQQLDGKLSGALTLLAKGKGKGLGSPALTRNLALDGQFELRDGVLRKLDAAEKIAAAIPHPSTQDVLRKDIHFGQMGSQLVMREGKLNVNNFYLSSGANHREGEVLVQANGWLKPGADLDFKITPRFNPRVVKLEGTLGEAFNDDQGWATYNYVAYYGPSSKQAKADFKQGAAGAAKKLVDKQIEKQKQVLQQKAQDEGKKLIEEKGGELLKGLFGK